MDSFSRIFVNRLDISKAQRKMVPESNIRCCLFSAKVKESLMLKIYNRLKEACKAFDQFTMGRSDYFSNYF